VLVREGPSAWTGRGEAIGEDSGVWTDKLVMVFFFFLWPTTSLAVLKMDYDFLYGCGFFFYGSYYSLCMCVWQLFIGKFLGDQATPKTICPSTFCFHIWSLCKFWFFILLFFFKSNFSIDLKSLLTTKYVEKDTVSDTKTSKIFFFVFFLLFCFSQKYFKNRVNN
jgi:hypothetical protein